MLLKNCSHKTGTKYRLSMPDLLSSSFEWIRKFMKGDSSCRLLLRTSSKHKRIDHPGTLNELNYGPLKVKKRPINKGYYIAHNMRSLKSCIQLLQ